MICRPARFSGQEGDRAISEIETDAVRRRRCIYSDRYPGSNLLNHIMRYEANPEIAMIACLGEVGGTDEYRIVEALKEGKITKPLVIWVTGTCSKVLPTSVQFGHAGARADSNQETADAKNQALRDAGAVVPVSFDDYGDKIGEVYERLKAEGRVIDVVEPEVPSIPMDCNKAVTSGLVRKPTSLICTISDDRGEEVLYGGKPLSKVIEDEMGIGGVIGLLCSRKSSRPGPPSS